MFERGFKAWCERLALEKRKELKLRPHDPLGAMSLAQNLGIAICTVENVPNLSDKAKRVLLKEDPDGWSAVTICFNGRKLIILNSAHSVGRQASDLMHELAHHLLGHKQSPVQISQEGLMMLHSYDQQQEAEADWLAGCLLLPREALVSIKRAQVDAAEAAKHYGVSMALLNYRLGVSGVNYQFS